MIACDAPPAIVQIVNDHGGPVWEYQQRFAQWRACGVQVRVAGACYSSCTMVLVLGAARVCVAPSTSFGFHAPYIPGHQGEAPNGSVHDATNAMMGSYPSGIRNWLGQKLTVGMRFLNAAGAVKLGAARYCRGV